VSELCADGQARVADLADEIRLTRDQLDDLVLAQADLPQTFLEFRRGAELLDAHRGRPPSRGSTDKPRNGLRFRALTQMSSSHTHWLKSRRGVARLLHGFCQSPDFYWPGQYGWFWLALNSSEIIIFVQRDVVPGRRAASRGPVLPP